MPVSSTAAIAEGAQKSILRGGKPVDPGAQTYQHPHAGLDQFPSGLKLFVELVHALVGAIHPLLGSIHALVGSIHALLGELHALLGALEPLEGACLGPVLPLGHRLQERLDPRESLFYFWFHLSAV